MDRQGFLNAGHKPSLFAAFPYFDISFMVWVLLVPLGVMTGLVGVTSGIGGFYLASSLGYSKQFTGSYQAGLLVFGGLALVALDGLTSVKKHWRTTWGASIGLARI